MSTKTKEKEFVEELVDVEEEKPNVLILLNDDVNTFDFVIESLVEICKHDYPQAEQCAFITHHKGQCDVKHGTFDKLKPMKDALLDRGLMAEINQKN